MPRPNSRAGGGPLRPHSRNSSSTKLGANLQFTTSAAPNTGNVPPAKKPNTGAGQQQAYTGAVVHDPPQTRQPAPPFARPASSQRVHSHSREQVARRLAPLQQYPPSGKNFSLHPSKKPGPNSKSGRPGTEDDEDEDEWESSESGAATPNQQSGSDTASDEGPDPALMNVQIPDHQQQQQQHAQQAQLQALLRQQHLLQQQEAQQQAQYQAQYQQQQYEQQMLQQKKREEAEMQEYLQQRHIEAQRQQKQEQERYFLQQQQQPPQQTQLQLQHQLYLQQKQLQQEQYLQQLQLQQQRQHLTQQQQYQLQQQQQQLLQSQHPPQVQTGFEEDSRLARVNTARPSDFEQTSGRAQGQAQQRPTSPRQHQTHQPQRQQAYPDQPPSDHRPQAPRTTSTSNPPRAPPSTTAPATTATEAHHSPRPRPASRPPSNQSMRSDRDYHHPTAPLRPHPLFRGISHGPPNPLPKPTPLAPLTVLPASSGDDHDGTVVTASPTVSSAGARYQMQMSTSPTGGSGSPGSVELPPTMVGVHQRNNNNNDRNDRRMSFSSARSSATLPPGPARESAWTHERTRTLSTMSAASSSAALSSLVNLPGNLMSPSPSTHSNHFNSNSSTGSRTRPPSPSASHLQQHFGSALNLSAAGGAGGLGGVGGGVGWKTVVYFPQTNPNVNVEAIHPLLPVPYLQNHLTVLERCTPLRESWERVVKAKNAVRSA